MMKNLLCTIPFQDETDGILRSTGKRFTAEDDRADELVALGFAEIIGVADEDSEIEVEEPVEENPNPKKEQEGTGDADQPDATGEEPDSDPDPAAEPDTKKTKKTGK